MVRSGDGVSPYGWAQGEAGDFMSGLLAPRFDGQIFCNDIEQVPSTPYIRMGDCYFSTSDVVTPAMVQRPFQSLLAALIQHDGSGENPWRISFKIEGSSSPKIGMRQMLAGILAATTPSSGYNRNIKMSLSYISDLAKANETICRVRVSLTTWSRVSEGIKKIEARTLAVSRAFEGWGEWQLTTATGNTIASTLATVPGLNAFSTAGAGYAPLREVLRLIPWSREVGPWGADGAMGLRTEDGRWFPITLGGTSNKQTTFNYLIVGTPGKGKSFFLATLYYSSCLSPGMTDGIGGYGMPYIRGMDFGHSQLGTTNAIRQWLPPHLQHEVLHITMQANDNHRINFFDTPLGCRTPPPTDVLSMRSILSTIMATEDGKSVEHMSDMVEQIVSDAFDYYSDKTRANSDPKRYDRTANVELHDVLTKYMTEAGLSMEGSEQWLWWHVVDQLALSFGDYYWASIAQRYAVPNMTDIVSFTTDSLVRQYDSVITSTGTGISLLKTFQLKAQGAVKQFPILRGPTNIGVGESRFAIMDVKNICSPFFTPEAYRQNAIMFLICDRALTSEFYRTAQDIHEDITNLDYHDYHLPRIRRMNAITKIKSLDEAVSYTTLTLPTTYSV